MELRHSGHGVYRTQYHVVWIAKYRRRILNPGLQGYVRKLFPKIMQSMPGVEIEKVGMEREHIHLIMIIPPKYAVSDVVGKVKQKVSSQLRKKFSWIKKVYWKEAVVWSPGYFVSTVGVDEEEIKKYVEWQGKKDSGQTKLNL